MSACVSSFNFYSILFIILEYIQNENYILQSKKEILFA